MTMNTGDVKFSSQVFCSMNLNEKEGYKQDLSRFLLILVHSFLFDDVKGSVSFFSI